MPPNSNRIADVSPMQPPDLPINKSKISTTPVPSDIFAAIASAPPFMIASGVAVDTASTPGAVQVVIGTGQEERSTALAASAGLMKLCPNPPKSCFATTIAKIDPINVIHHGKEAGTFSKLFSMGCVWRSAVARIRAMRT